MGETNSKRVVAELMAADPSVQCKGFARSIGELADGDCDEDSGVPIYELARRIVPDAFKIDAESVTIYEVVDSHPIRRAKASAISDLDDEIHEYLERDLWVVTLDYTGHETSRIPGWCYWDVYTCAYTVPGSVDITPAARAVFRNKEGQDEMDLVELRMMQATLES